MTEIECRVALGKDRLAAAAVRTAVFVGEQNVPFVLEIDARDFLSSTTHLVAVEPEPDAGGVERIVGAARLLNDGFGRFHVGRVAVLPPWRGAGVGRKLMAALTEIARAQARQGEPIVLVLDAQEQAMGFYESLGYRATQRPRFLDAGIWHREMRLDTTGLGSSSRLGVQA